MGYIAIKNRTAALAGVAQWIECWPVNQRVAGSIPSQGTCLGCRPGPQQEACEKQPHIKCFSPLLLPFSLKINKLFKKNYRPHTHQEGYYQKKKSENNKYWQ